MTTQARFDSAYLAGRNARNVGKKLHQNPHANPRGDDLLREEWERGFADQDTENKARSSITSRIAA